jgi:hypothetical protein
MMAKTQPVISVLEPPKPIDPCQYQIICLYSEQSHNTVQSPFYWTLQKQSIVVNMLFVSSGIITKNRQWTHTGHLPQIVWPAGSDIAMAGGTDSETFMQGAVGRRRSLSPMKKYDAYFLCLSRQHIYPGKGCWFSHFAFHVFLSHLAQCGNPTTCYVTKNLWSQTRPSSLVGSPHQMDEVLMI